MIMTMPRSVLEHKTPTAIESFGVSSIGNYIEYHIDKRTLEDITFSFYFNTTNNQIFISLSNNLS